MGGGYAFQLVVLIVSLVAGGTLLVVVHVLGDRHEYAFVALDAVAGLDLGCCKDGNRDGKEDHQNGNLLFGKDGLEPLPEILAEDDCENNDCNKLDCKKGQGQLVF